MEQHLKNRTHALFDAINIVNSSNGSSVQPVHLNGIAMFFSCITACLLSYFMHYNGTTELHFPGGKSALSSENPMVVTSEKSDEALV